MQDLSDEIAAFGASFSQERFDTNHVSHDSNADEEGREECGPLGGLGPSQNLREGEYQICRGVRAQNAQRLGARKRPNENLPGGRAFCRRRPTFFEKLVGESCGKLTSVAVGRPILLHRASERLRKKTLLRSERSMDERHIHPDIAGDVSKAHLIVRIFRESDDCSLENPFARGVGRAASARSPQCLRTVLPLSHEPIMGGFVSNDRLRIRRTGALWSRESQQKCIRDMNICIGGAALPEFSIRGERRGVAAHRKSRRRFDAPQGVRSFFDALFQATTREANSAFNVECVGMLKAKDVMSTNIVVVSPDTPVQKVAELMLQRHISGLPVVDSAGALVGVVTEGDLLTRAEIETNRRRPRWIEFLVGPRKSAAEFVHSHGRSVAHVMSNPVETVSENETIDNLVQTMVRKRIKRLPIVRDGHLVGLVSRADILRALSFAMSKDAATLGASDAEIRSAVLSTITAQSWAPVSLLNVTVENGHVNLWGTLLDESVREGLMVAAATVPGVKSVRDHMVFVEPYFGAVAGPPPERDSKTDDDRAPDPRIV